jgi:2-oxoglutarate dehydrogenase E2 component (dihydrolipoamide succinyltransferase)
VAVQIVVPQLGESIAEGTVSKWLKAEGDKVQVDEPVVEIMTDKVTVEIPSPAAGVIARLLVAEGITVPVGEPIAEIAGEGETISEAPKAAPVVAAPAPAPAPAPAATAPVAATAVAPSAPPPNMTDGKRPYLSPVVRRLAREHGIDAAMVPGTGRAGRVTREDMLAYIEGAKGGVAVPGAPLAPVGPVVTGPMEEVIPITGIRAVISERMTQSMFTATHVTTFEEADVSALVRLRKQHKDAILKKHGVRLTFTPFFIKAAILALREFPTMNATWQGNEAVILKRYHNIGVAVGRDAGLIVPVVKDAGSKGLIEVARVVNDLSERAQSNRLTPDELQGGTFSITNAGLFGSIASTPIINYPEVAILGVHKIADRPTVVGGEVVVRPMTTLAVTFDHRWIDGHIAVQFVVRIKEILEQPENLWFSV